MLYWWIFKDYAAVAGIFNQHSGGFAHRQIPSMFQVPQIVPYGLAQEFVCLHLYLPGRVSRIGRVYPASGLGATTYAQLE